MGKEAKKALTILLGKDFVSKHVTKEPQNIEEERVNETTLENMKKYVNEVVDKALAEADKDMIATFLSYKYKQFLGLCKQQPEQVVRESLEEVILYCMRSSPNIITERLKLFSSHCVPFPSKQRLMFWDILMEKMKKPRKIRTEEFSLPASSIIFDEKLQEEVVNHKMAEEYMPEVWISINKKHNITRYISGSTTTFCKQSSCSSEDGYPGGSVHQHPLGVHGDQNQ